MGQVLHVEIDVLHPVDFYVEFKLYVVIDRLRSSGWVSYAFDGGDLTAHLLDLAMHLGTPVAARRRKSPVEILTPLGCAEAKPSSPSRMFGLGAIPLHTDTAHWVEPCRYIILGCVAPGSCGRRTMIADSLDLGIDSETRRNLRDCQFRVLNGRRSFFAPVLGPNDSFLRFDQACMALVDARSRAALGVMSQAISDLPVETIDWFEGRVLLMDNWRVLHGRTAPARVGGGRVLARVLVQ